MEFEKSIDFAGENIIFMVTSYIITTLIIIQGKGKFIIFICLILF